jgi:hypothetical protein
LNLQGGLTPRGCPLDVLERAADRGNVLESHRQAKKPDALIRAETAHGLRARRASKSRSSERMPVRRLRNKRDVKARSDVHIGAVFDGDDRAVFAPDLVQPTLLRATYERIPQTFVDFGRIWRSQIDNRLAKEFRTGIASQRASLVVDRHIPTVIIRDKNRGWNALEV